jgi:competence protein ComEC
MQTPQGSPTKGRRAAVERPLVPLAVAFTLGVATERLAGAGQAAWLLAAVAAGLVGAGAWRRGAAATARVAAIALFGCLGAYALSGALEGRPAGHASRLPDGALVAPVALEGWVAQPPDPRPGDAHDPEEPPRTRLVAELLRVRLGDRWHPVTGRVRLTLYEQVPVVAYGDEVAGTFRLRHPRRFDNPGSFDYPAYLAAQGISLEGWTRSPVEVRPAARGSRLLQPIFALRSLLLTRLHAAMPGGQGALLRAMVLGDRSGLTAEMNQAFLDSGTFHILAISGLNVSLLAGALFGLFRLLRLSPRLAAACAACLVTLYAALAGGGASVVRAAVMADVYLLAVVLDRRADLLNTLALAGLALLWWNPRFLTDVGFQLTVLATLGIALALPLVEPWLERVPRPVRWALASTVITLAATLITLPVLAGSFNRISPVGVLANVPIVPLAGLLTALGTASCAVLLPFPAAAAWLIQIAGWLVDLLLALAGWFAAWPFATVDVFTPTPAMYAAYYTALAGGLAAAAARGRDRRWPALGLASAGVLALALLVLVRLSGRDDATLLRLTVLDVGQGESILVELPGRRRVLVDAGSLGGDGLDVGKHVVAPYLRHEWIGRIDALVLTHAQSDHMSGAPAILRSFRVGEVWSPAPLGRSATGLWIEEYCRHHGVPHRVVSAGASLAAGAARVRVLYPAKAGEDAGSRREPPSLVLAVDIAGRTALLTGDITAREGEAEVSASGVRAEVLKVPHHGSKTSSGPAFLDAVRPEVALVSVGYRNRFRHPHPEVLDRYAARGVRVLRTDLHGAITVEMSPDGIRARGRRGGAELGIEPRAASLEPADPY